MYNYKDVISHFGLSNKDLINLIDEGVLLPDEISVKGNRSYFIKQEYKNCTWDRTEIIRFENISNLSRSKDLNYRMMANRIVGLEQSFTSKFDEIKSEIRVVQNTNNDLLRMIGKATTMIGSEYFCKLTGTAKSTFRNNVVYVPGTNEKNMGMPYEVLIDEDKKTGRFKPRVRISIEDLEKDFKENG